jgi:hypothetical protein
MSPNNAATLLRVATGSEGYSSTMAASHEFFDLTGQVRWLSGATSGVRISSSTNSSKWPSEFPRTDALLAQSIPSQTCNTALSIIEGFETPQTK